MTPNASILLDRAREVWRHNWNMSLSDSMECETFIKVLAACESDAREVDGDMEAFIMHKLEEIEARS